jgi:hypothetical protein
MQRVAGFGIVVVVGGAFSTAASASPHTAKQEVTTTGSHRVNLTRVATNCGDGVSYLPARGQAMTAADFASLGMPVPPTSSPLAKPDTRWVVPHCAPLPAGQHPGGPAAHSPLAVPHPAGSRNTGSTQMAASANWTGFQSNGGGPYEAASLEWYIPASFPKPPGNTYESSWPGIGSGASNSDALLQAGTETNVNTSGGVTNYAWWEFYPMNSQQGVNLPIQSGSFDFAEVLHTGYGLGEVELCTWPPGASSWTCTTFNVSWGTAYTIGTPQFECIAERTEVNGIYPRLTNITSAQFYGCQAYTNRWQEIGNINRYYWWMAKTQTRSQCHTAPWAIETGTIYNSDNFGFRWYGYGWPIPAADC